MLLTMNRATQRCQSFRQKQIKIFWGVALVGILPLLFASLGFSGKYPDVRPVSPPLMQPETAQPVVRQIAPGLFEVGGCNIIKQKHQVIFPAIVNLDQGIVEYLIVNTAGKVHSSLFQTSVETEILQFSLLMIGLSGTLNPLKEQGESRIPEGDRVKISIVWKENGKESILPIEQMILKQGNVIDHIPWVFTGSNYGITGQAENSLVAIYHDPAALIDHQLMEGNNSKIWSVDKEKVPPAGTLVQVMIEPLVSGE